MADLITRLRLALAHAYRVDRELGSGGMATVFLAEDLKHGRRVAIKVLSPEVAESAGRRFPQEIRLTAALQHSHILALYDSGEADGLLYYVMPYVEGETLRQRLDRERQLPVEETVKLLTELADALDYAHGQGIVHRDLKPENVLLGSGHALLADFGIARALGGGAARLTTRGGVVGTPFYMSPEQAADGTVDGRSDQYSLACVVFEMLAGQPPFTGPMWESLAHQHLSAAPPPVTNLRPGLPPGVGAALTRALAKTPADRFPTASAFAAAVAQAVRVPAETPTAPLAAAGGTRGGSEGRGELVPRRAVAIALGVAIVTVAGSLVWWRSHAGVTTGIDSVAVLPLANLSGDPEQLYLAEGMTDELIGELVRIRSLRVISRTSVMGYRERPKPLRQVARELNVRSVLEGSVRRVGERVRVTASLVDATNDRELWSASYDRELGDVLTMQREIARALVERVRVHLTAAERTHLLATRAVDPRAHEACVRAKLLLDRTDEANFRQALGLFEQALRIDSTYAEAWAGLGSAYYYLSSLFVPPNEAMPKAREAAERALALDPELGMAEATLGMVSAMYEYRWDESERHFRRAMELSPGDASIHWLFALTLGVRGQTEVALRHARAAQSLDPLSEFPLAEEVWILYLEGRFQESVATGLRAVARDSSYSVLWSNLAESYLELGQLDEALRCARRGVLLNGSLHLGRIVLGTVLARAGRLPEARQEFQRLLDEPRIQLTNRARISAALGEKEQALDLLERALAEHDEEVCFVRMDPTLRPLWSEPRFQALTTKIGLPRGRARGLAGRERRRLPLRPSARVVRRRGGCVRATGWAPTTRPEAHALPGSPD